MLASHNSLNFFQIFLMIIQSYIKASLTCCLLHKMHSIKYITLLLGQNAVIVWQLKVSFRNSFIASKFQCFYITLLMFGQNQFKGNVSGIYACFGCWFVFF